MFALSRRESFGSLRNKNFRFFYGSVQKMGISLLPQTCSASLRQNIPTSALSQKQQQEHILRIFPVLSLLVTRRTYFTNGKVIKDKDPYAVLGLQWGEAATTSELKAAFRRKARELHPDVNTTDTPEQAKLKFMKLKQAYEMLVPSKDSASGDANLEEWRVAIWRQGDRIAVDRTDVAGQAKLRPAPPATTSRHKYLSGELGHPQGLGLSKRGEYLEATVKSGSSRRRSSSVGTGRNKWVKPKEFKPWNPSEIEVTD